MRVLMLNDFASGGGAEVVVDLETRLLEGAGHTVRRLTGEDVGRPGPIGYVEHRAARRAVRRAIEDFDPDVVHAHNVYHLLSPAVLAEVARVAAGRSRSAGEAARRPRLVLTAHDFHLVCPNSGLCSFDGGVRRIEDPQRWRASAWPLVRGRWDHRARWRSWAKLAQHLWNHRWRGRWRCPDAIVCPGPAAAAVLQAGGVPARVLPNPFDPGDVAGVGDVEGARDVASVERIESVGDAGHTQADRVARAADAPFVFAGRVEPEKGLAELIAIWPADGPSLDVYGDGDALEACRAAVGARGLDDRIRLHGRAPRTDVLQAIGAAAGLVVPSRWPEVAPMVILEALALGTPIVGPDLGAMQEAIEATGAGATFALDDGVSLRAALDAAPRTMEDPGVRDRCRSHLDARRPEAHLADLLAVYRGEDATDG